MELNFYTNKVKLEMEKAVQTYSNQIAKISAGKANPKLISGIKFIYYDEPMSIEEMAAISVPEAQQILIKPYDIKTTKNIIESLNKMNYDMQIVDEGAQVRLKFPALTTERRKELVKQLVKLNESAKVAIRQVRQDENKLIKKDEELSEDEQKKYLDEIQKLTDKYIFKIEELNKDKEKELMTI
ncbi:ribosome recycling factor [[Mycoplasma] mobile]|uniref:Ribosome-recycling factor n=1 Tax=Mycoplasma mobile (strain ATCC 43663 / 163K / NCTC 11711) TaxID=267748 RepID=RRF_MYCM1|nr:ribosome recycling factor [[Mycoplasma] mobile]Q6KIN5.1 RecName: Full=Ribosome-recycling factor; Short=RRF; AltName: Full=Ribosome-releasing factor [Mycoplasma mobile 163K]AAT27541.1 ribosome recycling factor [Mycoplasma mobile 163K]